MNIVEAKSDTVHSPTRTLEAAGKSLAYRTIGSGEPFILCNRFRGTLDTWDPAFIDELAKTFEVILFDYSGIGHSGGPVPESVFSMVEDARAMVDGLHLDRCIIGGWSLGGVVAQGFIAEYPHRVSHAIVIGSNPPGKLSHAPEKIFFERATKPVNDFEDEVVLFFEPNSPASRIAAEATHHRLAKRKEDLDILVPPEAFLIMLQKVGSDRAADLRNLRGAIQRTAVPMLILSGDHDVSFPVENWHELSRSLPTAQHIVFPASGHGPQHQYPITAARYIKAFVETSG